MTTTGELIKKYRKQAGLTQEQLAKKIGVSLMSVRRYESNERVVTEEILQKIAVVLGCSKWDLRPTMTMYEMYQRDIESIPDMSPIKFPNDPLRQRALNRVSLAISVVDDEGVRTIEAHAKFIEQQYIEKMKKDNEK